MKPNEAPENIYILNHKDYSDRRILNAFTEKEDNTDIKYIRTDAFIEKACEWLKENKDKYLYNTGERDECIPTCSNKMIEDFKKYMED